MISYSTNYMGPASLEWFRSRGFTKIVTRTVDSEFVSTLRKMPIGETYEVEEITEQCAGGRIDIYGLDDTEYYCGRSEYSLPPMKVKSWNMFSDWLDDFETEELWEFDEIIDEFETQCNTTIEWIDY